RDEQLRGGGRRDHRADVTSVEHRAARLVCKIDLALKQRAAHLRVNRHPAGEAARAFVAQRGVIEKAGGKIAGLQRVGGIVGVAMVKLRLIADRAIEQACVQHRQPEMGRQRPCDRALARSGGAVDSDDHGCSPASKASKLGKLVATGAMSSISTGALLTRPAIAKLMQMRWSRWPAITAPPGRGSPPLPSMTRPSALSSTRAPIASSPAAMTASRSLSLTR